MSGGDTACASVADQEVVVIGGGWSGLAAAFELARAGRRVRLLESSPQLGGRARNAPFNGSEVDNGQHLLIGAYSETLRLLREAGVNEHDALLRLPLTLQVASLDDAAPTLRLRAPRLPAPFHLSTALLSAAGLRLGERLAALRMSLALMLRGFRLAEDCSVSELLRRHRQPLRLVESLWEPLCLAALNTPAAEASAQVFLHVLKESFAHRRADSDLLIPRRPLGELFAQPLAAAIREAGGRIDTACRATGLVIEGGELCGVQVRRKGIDEVIEAEQAIIALPPHAVSRLCGEAVPMPELGLEPIVTLYMQFSESQRLEPPMQGLVGGHVQWLFDRRVVGQPGLMALVTSGDGPHMALDNEALSAAALAELRHLYPDWPAPQACRVIRERRATFKCDVGIESRRPRHDTPITGLWLAGDFTLPGYPATLEAAVRSGVQCARFVEHS